MEKSHNTTEVFILVYLQYKCFISGNHLQREIKLSY